MPRHRVFIAINFPKSIKEKVRFDADQFPDLPIRITKSENLHLTLVFIGYVDNEELMKLMDALPEVGNRHEPFWLKFSEISYGPDMKNPRMIWLRGEMREELKGLQKDLAETAASLNIRHFRLEKRPFIVVHATLARMREMEWRNVNPKPDIHKKVDIQFPVETFELMESVLKRNGAEYSTLQSFPLLG